MKGKIEIAGRIYDCEVIDGVRYIDGMPASEFLEHLPLEEQFKFAVVGSVKVESEKSNIPLSAKALYESLDKKPN